MISVKSSRSNSTEKALRKLQNLNLDSILHAAGQAGVAALANAVPKDTGVVARSWSYEIKPAKNGFRIVWSNSDVENGFPVAIMLQYGYATGTGGYVAGRDYINPAIRPVMDQIAADVWRAVTDA